MKKILASVAAAALAVSAMSVAAFAEAEEEAAKTHEGSVTIVGENWWAEAEVPVEELIGDLDPDEVTSITFTCADHDFVIGYNAEKDWVQSEVKAGDELVCTDILLKTIDVPTEEDPDAKRDPALKACISANDGKDYVISWVASTEKPEEPKPEGLETALYVGENVTWTTAHSDSVYVKIGGEYTYSISGLDIAPEALTVIYIKDVAVENKEATESDIDPVKVTFKSVKINGNEVAVMEGAPDSLNDSGAFDLAIYNIWGDSFIELPEETIESVELVVAVEEGVAEDPEETDPEETDPEETDPEATEPETTTGAAGSVNDPTDDKNQPTGLVIAVVPAAVAAVAVVISKKRK